MLAALAAPDDPGMRPDPSRLHAGWTRIGDVEPDPLHLVRVAKGAFEFANDTLHEMVSGARRAGYSWSAIADVLGTSRQAAQKRFARRRLPKPRQPSAAAVQAILRRSGRLALPARADALRDARRVVRAAGCRFIQARYTGSTRTKWEDAILLASFPVNRAVVAYSASWGGGEWIMCTNEEIDERLARLGIEYRRTGLDRRGRPSTFAKAATPPHRAPGRGQRSSP
jgi:hypothetical protein